MKIDKEHFEFFQVDMEKEGWVPVPGYPTGIQHKILTGFLDEENKVGFRTRLIRFDAGVYTTKPFVHDYWEELMIIEGDLIVGNDENGEGGESFGVNTYACRPPGVYHGPFKTETGCVLIEMHYYENQ